MAGTQSSDTFTAPAGTLRNADVIVDGSTTDKDVLNITLNGADITAIAGAAGPTISGIERINVNIDAFAGTATTIDAQNMSAGTTLTLSSTKPGFDGAAGVTAARGTNVVAGTNVSTLTVANLSSGTVDAGGAATLNLTTDATRTDTAKIKVNGDVALNYTGTARNAVIEATKNAVINTIAGDGGALNNLGLPTATAPGLITTTGVGNITLRDDAADLTGRFVKHTGTGTLTVRLNNDAIVDVSNMSGISGLVVPAGYSSAATVVDGITITPRPGVAAFGAATFNNAEPNVGAIQGDSLNVVLGGASAGALTFGGFQEVNFTQSGGQTVGAITQNLANGAGPAIAGTTSLKFKGSGDLVLAATTAPVAGTNGTDVIDASGITGGLTYTAPTGAQKVFGGASTNVISSETAGAGQLDYVGQNAGDVINARVIGGVVTVKTGSGADTVRIAPATAAGAVGNLPTTGTVTTDLGAGNDLVTVGLNANSAVAIATGAQLIGTNLGSVSLDAGAGTDTLRIATGANFYGLSAQVTAAAGGNITQTISSVKGFERIELQEADGARAAATPLDVTAATFLLNGSDATVAVRYGIDTGTGNRYTIDDVAVASRLHLNDNLGSSATARNVDLSKVKFDITRLVDQFIVETGNASDVITLPTTLAGQVLRVDGNGGNDRIIVGDGPGVTNIILGAGSDTVDLTKSTSANVIAFANGTGVAATAAQVTGTHTITGWKPQTLLDVEAFATGGVAFGGAAGLGVLGTQSALTTNLVTVISTTGAAANLTLEGGAVITDFTSAEQLANYLGERYTTAATNEQVFAINNTNAGVNKSYIWLYSELVANPIVGNAAADAVFNADNFALLAVVENGGVGLTTANFATIDQAALILAGVAAPTANIWVA